jgi:hypothetical protein
MAKEEPATEATDISGKEWERSMLREAHDV